jgi:hypothetical protein
MALVEATYLPYDERRIKSSNPNDNDSYIRSLLVELMHQLTEIKEAINAGGGSVTFATGAEAVTGTVTDKVISPATLTSRMQAPGDIGGTTPAKVHSTILRLVATDTQPTVGEEGWLWYKTTDNSVYIAVE